ncbi:Manganese/iron superoxide dismutase [Syncephalis fuscata]|nr:Manganese/iron superoxide dismutase [Syncephalis fuscata]
MYGITLLRTARQSTRLLRRSAAFQSVQVQRNLTTEPEPLRYNVENGLEPLFKPATLVSYYNDQHVRLRKRLAMITKDSIYEKQSLTEMIAKTARQPSNAVIFNHASQLWNEEFFLKSLTPSSVEMTSALDYKFKEHFGSVEQFKTQFSNQALTMFGSGWVWLVEDNMSRWRIINTFNAGSPLTPYRTQMVDGNTSDHSATEMNEFQAQIQTVPDTLRPLLCLNVWEHAYVIDHGIAGLANYTDTFWNNVDWNVVEQRTSQSAGSVRLPSSSYKYGVGGFYGV